MEINPDVQMPDYAFNRLKGNYRDKPIIVDPEQPGAIAPTCVAHYAKDQQLIYHLSLQMDFCTMREYADIAGRLLP